MVKLKLISGTHKWLDVLDAEAVRTLGQCDLVDAEECAIEVKVPGSGCTIAMDVPHKEGLVMVVLGAVEGLPDVLMQGDQVKPVFSQEHWDQIHRLAYVMDVALRPLPA